MMKNTDIKATIKKNILASFFLAVGAVLVIIGLITIAPAISTNSEVLLHNKYVAAVISKSVYISVGALICCISALKMEIVKKEEK